jgi:hypothetical protein
MRLPRMPTLRWVIATVAIGPLMYAGIGGVWLWRRHSYFHARAQGCAEEGSRLRSYERSLISESERGDWSHGQRLIERKNEMAKVVRGIEYASEMEIKYRRAACYPWLSVKHELPEPW